jgi:two-component system nitrogen regulation response regulator GlnG
MGGTEFLEHSMDVRPAAVRIILTGYTDVDALVKAVNLSRIFRYVIKPWKTEELRGTLQRAIETFHLVRENARLVEELGRANARLAVENAYLRDRDKATMPTEIVGDSAAIHKVLELVGRVASTGSTVLVTGETGTGKELVARALHRHSPRAAKAFIALNTSAFTADLLESELFGHEKGAFTGATELRRGRFEQADGGTLFLDEIGDMSPALQTRLLRVLAEGEFYRVGGQLPVRVDVRVIAATHQDLEDRVAGGQFREDLLHRLNVIRIDVPPLRQRREDVPELLRHYLDVAALELGVAPKSLTEEAQAALIAFHWSGNVRQLVNACRRLTVVAAGREITRADIPTDLGGGSAAAVSSDWAQALAAWAQSRLAAGDSALLDDATPEFERTLIREALRTARGGRQEAARLLGWGRNTLTRKLKELGLDEQ